jgi:hypothetical protein
VAGSLDQPSAGAAAESPNSGDRGPAEKRGLSSAKELLLGAFLGALGLAFVWWLRTSAQPSVRTKASENKTLASPGVDTLGIVNSAGLKLQLYLLSPAAFGVSDWTIGDTAGYVYRGPDSGPARDDKAGVPTTREVRVSVIGRAGQEDELVARGLGTPGNSWLWLDGLETFRGKPYDRYALVRVDDMRPGRRWPLYSLQEGYFPQFDRMVDLRTCDQAVLDAKGVEVVETPAGTFSANRFEARIGSAVIDVWASPSAGPLGIVRLRSPSEELVLTHVARDQAEVPIDAVVEPLIRGVSTFALGCLSCHLDPRHPGSVEVPAR